MSHDTDPRADTLPCPACETEIAVADSFCRSCGANVAGIDETGRLTSCPECGTDIDPGDSFCRHCGEHLESYRPGASGRGADRAGGVGATVRTDDDAGSEAASAGGSGSGARSEPDRAVDAESETDTPTAESETDTATAESPDDAADERQESTATTSGPSVPDSGTSESETSATEPAVPGSESAESEEADSGASDSGASASDTETEPETGSGEESAVDEGPKLSLVARNREIEVGDGDTVGKEIRSIIMDTGGEEEDAVRVHREHVRFEREDDQFYVVDQGKNPTSVNGEELEEGDRVPVSPGDRIDLSGVAKIGIREA
jgi:predicted RNA-binding Zn-ribbon protein involved in translation (DUF1610 family)